MGCVSGFDCVRKKEKENSFYTVYACGNSMCDVFDVTFKGKENKNRRDEAVDVKQ